MSELEIRPCAEGDHAAVMALLVASLGWHADGRHEAFFRWKHEANPFGSSPAWVATDDGEVIGFRSFMRWEFTDGSTIRRAVRAVDTATHPDHQGRGIFKKLTLHGLAELADEGVDFVFNTPNDQSRPGYLKMGWEQLGRLPLRVRPASLRSVPKMLRARTAADLWSTPTDDGLPAGDALADVGAVTTLLESQPIPESMRTRRSVAYLQWRYAGLPALAYRVTFIGDTPAAGFAVWRLRRRGPALEAAIVEVIAPRGDRNIIARLAQSAAKESGGDYSIAVGDLPARSGFLPFPAVGPVLTRRTVGPAAGGLGLGSFVLGDVELF